MQYFFILGKNPELSLAELVSIVNCQLSIVHDSVVIAESEKPLDLQAIQKRLGGTVKCGEIIGTVSRVSELPDFISGHALPGTGKYMFGFSVYVIGGTVNTNSIIHGTHAIGIEIKHRLKKEGISSRLVSSKEPELSSVIVKKEKLLDNGWDVCLFCAEQKETLVGRTVAVQDFRAYGERDYGRPGSDSLSGMLPPKLAKIMINLANVPAGGSILDPFCGSGTVLQEALVLGYSKITGNDMEAKAVADTKQNIAWLKDTYGIDTSGVEVLRGEAEKISLPLAGRQFDAIVTEPYLGPALRGRESVQELLKTKRGLEQLYRSAFEQYAEILKPGGRVVMVFPVFVTGLEKMSIDIIEDVKKMGFSVINPISHLSSTLPPSPFRWPLMYFREGQKVYREIWVFEKK